MFMLPEIIATAVSGGGQMLTSLFNAKEQSKANDRMEQNHWEDVRITREDNNTAAQRRAKDMQAAGINPLLAAGNAAGSYSGSSPSLVAPQIVAPDILPALQFMETMKNNKADRSLKKAQENQIKTQTASDALGGSFGQDMDDLYRGTKNIFKDPIKNNPFKGLKDKLMNEFKQKPLKMPKRN